MPTSTNRESIVEVQRARGANLRRKGRGFSTSMNASCRGAGCTSLSKTWPTGSSFHHRLDLRHVHGAED